MNNWTWRYPIGAEIEKTGGRGGNAFLLVIEYETSGGKTKEVAATIDHRGGEWVTIVNDIDGNPPIVTTATTYDDAVRAAVWDSVVPVELRWRVHHLATRDRCPECGSENLHHSENGLNVWCNECDSWADLV